MIKNLRTEENRNYAIDALKAICCIMVIWHHSVGLGNEGESIYTPIAIGWIAVHIFL